MTDIELLEILERPASNLEKALAIRTLLKATQPSALNIKPQVQRTKRAQKAPEIKGGIPGDLLNGAAHEGPTQYNSDNSQLQVGDLEAQTVSMQRWIDHHNQRADKAERILEEGVRMAAAMNMTAGWVDSAKQILGGKS